MLAGRAGIGVEGERLEVEASAGGCGAVGEGGHGCTQDKIRDGPTSGPTNIETLLSKSSNGPIGMHACHRHSRGWETMPLTLPPIRAGEI
jgi:hypothetical protein